MRLLTVCLMQSCSLSFHALLPALGELLRKRKVNFGSEFILKSFVFKYELSLLVGEKLLVEVKKVNKRSGLYS